MHVRNRSLFLAGGGGGNNWEGVSKCYLIKEREDEKYRTS